MVTFPNVVTELSVTNTLCTCISAKMCNQQQITEIITLSWYWSFLWHHLKTWHLQLTRYIYLSTTKPLHPTLGVSFHDTMKRLLPMKILFRSVSPEHFWFVDAVLVDAVIVWCHLYSQYNMNRKSTQLLFGLTSSILIYSLGFLMLFLYICRYCHDLMCQVEKWIQYRRAQSSWGRKYYG